MAEKMIKVSRYRAGEYTVNYNMNGRIVTYRWAGCKPEKYDTKEIPDYVVDWLLMSTNTFKNGSLVIEEPEVNKDIVENIDTEDEYTNNIHTRDEIEKLLTGNTNKMKAELNKITIQAEKDFVVNVAKDIKIDSVAKRKFLAEWTGISEEMLFADEE